MNRISIVFLTTLLLAHAASAKDVRRSMTINDLSSIRDVSGPSISPDGKTVVYAVSEQNLKRDAANSDIWSVSFQGGEPKALTKTDDKSEWAPKYSPDGKTIAFLSDNTKEGETQIFLMKSRGGNARQISKIDGGVQEFNWAPDSDQIVLTAFVGGAKPNDAGTVPPIVIDRFQFKEDWNDYLTTNRLHMFILDVDKKNAKQITNGEKDHWLPAWSPDGKWIAFVSKDNGDVDRNMDSDVFIMEPQIDAQTRRLSHFKGTDVDPYWLSPPAWSPDSKQLVWLQSKESKWIYYAPWQLTIADVESGKNRNIARIDRSFYTPKWSSDGRTIYALIEQDRSTWLAKIDSQTGEVDYVNEGNRFALEYDVSQNGNIVLLDSTDDRPFELVAIDENERKLTNHNSWLDGIELGITKPFSFVNNGHVISGIMTLPSGYKEGQKLPTIFRLHGGPVYQFSHEFMSDWQIYAANGFATVGINPRGSSGKGFDFAKAIYADWGNVDVSDILSGSDYLVNEGIVDPDRMGVGGWSYGGILTDYVIGTDQRFKAAISGAGAANMLGTYGHDQYSREYELELGTPWENFEAYKRVSYPFLNADRITTPTLFQCSEKDFNVPCLGSEQMYQALRSVGVDTRLVIYPNQHHGITVPSYLFDRMKRNLNWYKKYLIGAENEVE
jgi:dipeptidyl aminopeptidase/acylaminoacyl peptidase